MRQCPLCGGNIKEGITTYAVDLSSSLIVVKNVPADICDQCGEEWFTPEVSKKLEQIVNNIKEKKPELEIIRFNEAA